MDNVSSTSSPASSPPSVNDGPLHSGPNLATTPTRTIEIGVCVCVCVPIVLFGPFLVLGSSNSTRMRYVKVCATNGAIKPILIRILGYIIICKPSTTNCNLFRVTWFVFQMLICGIYHIIIIIFSMQINPGILYLTLQFLQPLTLLTQCTLPPIVPSHQEEQEK